MRLADDQDLGGDGFTTQDRERYTILATMRETTERLAANIARTKRIAETRCPSAVLGLTIAEDQLRSAIEHIRRDLAVLMGDET